MSRGLYRNYICRGFDCANSTGFNEDVYDAVVVVGGAGLTPEALNELMRITKPGTVDIRSSYSTSMM